MRRMRLVGILLAAVAILAVVAATVPAIRGQAKGTDRQPQASRDLAQALGPDIQFLGPAGPEIGVTIRDGDQGEGVVVDTVRSDSPASKAGVKAGDIIAEFDGEKVRSSRQLTRLVQETPVGRAVKLTVMRAGKRMDLAVTPEARASGVWSDQLRADTDKLRQSLREGFGGNGFWYRSPGSGRPEILPPEGESGLFGALVQPGVRLGVTVQDMTQQLSSYFGAKQGVLVTSVTEGSAADKAGLKAGDVITAVNDQAVTSSTDLVRKLRAGGGDTEVAIAIVRDRKAITVKAKPDSPASRSPRVIRRTIVV